MRHEFIEAFGRHIGFDRSSTVTGVYTMANKVMVGCFPIEAFRLHKLLKVRTTQYRNMFVKVNKENYNLYKNKRWIILRKNLCIPNILQRQCSAVLLRMQIKYVCRSLKVDNIFTYLRPRPRYIQL